MISNYLKERTNNKNVKPGTAGLSNIVDPNSESTSPTDYLIMQYSSDSAVFCSNKMSSRKLLCVVFLSFQ